MKKGIPLLILLLVFVSVFFVVVQTLKGRINRDFTKRLPEVTEPKVTVVPTVSEAAIEKSIFVPYWTLNKDSSLPEDGTVIYFGVVPTKDGIDESDQGYKKLQAFSRASETSKRLLALRMLDQDETLAILKDPRSQDAVIASTISLARANNFSGIVLDLELTALPFDSLVNEVTGFVEKFNKQVKSENLTFSMTMYGDAFYRVRPFDVKALAQHVDSFFIMAYDFNKSGGNPGPNFPLSGQETYGYDYATMLTQFSGVVPARKLEVTYGMFGYDWIVDDKGNATIDGTPLSLKEIQATVLSQCHQLHCQEKRDELSSEMKVLYTDTDGRKHTVWFDDDASVQKKEALAKKMGISRFSFWAYSYF